MANEDNEQWQLPEPLRITNPEVAAAAAEFQKKMAEANPSPLATTSPREREIQRAARMAEHLEKDYDRLVANLNKIPANEVPEYQEALRAIEIRLADAYVTLGRYDRAALIDPRPEYRDAHRRVLAAIQRPDDEWCNCPPGRDFIEQEVVSHQHGGMTPLRVCGGCKTANVAPMPAHLAEQRSMEERAAAMTKGLTPAEAAQRLRAAGLTSEKLAKK